MQETHDAEWQLVRIYRALGDMTRLRMLRLLADRDEMGCEELAGKLGLSRPTLSHHTRILHDCRLIDVRREGAHRYYRLRRDVLERYAPELILSSSASHRTHLAQGGVRTMAEPTGATGSAVQTETWVFDPSHSIAEFSVRHMMIATVKGRFKKMEGKIVGSLQDPERASVELSIDVNSIDTGEPQRDAHLRSADFFDAEHYPTLTFKSRRIERTGDGRFRVVGDLTMRGVTKEVPVDVTFEGQVKDPWGNQRAAFSAETKVNRKEWGLNWNALLEAGGVVVGDEVKISVHVEAIRQG